MTLQELLQLRAAKIKEADELLLKCETEKRDITEDEQKTIDGLFAEIDKLSVDITTREKVEKYKIEIASRSQEPAAKLDPEDPGIGMPDKDIKKYSIVRAIRAAANGDWKEAGLEKEASDAVAKKLGKEARTFFVPYDYLEKRDMTIGSAAGGGYLKSTDLLSQSFIEMLRNKMLVKQAGAMVLSGLVGDIAIPRQSGGATAYWVAESGAPSESQQTLQQVTLAPKTVAAYTDISRKLLKQASIDVEVFVRNDLTQTLALETDRAALHGSGSSNQPTGIQNQTGVAVVALGTNGLAPTWASIIDLETQCAQDNADMGTLSYMTNAKVRGKLKGTLKTTTYGDLAVWSETGNPLNGYPAWVTNQVASDLTKGSGSALSAIFYGNWRDLVIAQWGGLDILVDPYTGGTTGTVRVIVFQDTDIAVRHGESFSMIVDAITS